MNKFWRSSVQHCDYQNNTVLYTWNLLTRYILSILTTKKEKKKKEKEKKKEEEKLEKEVNMWGNRYVNYLNWVII